MSRTNFKELKIWQIAKDIAVDIYRITDNSKIKSDFSLRDQMRRAAISIASNIAEGNDRESNKEFVRYLYIAKGSCSELITQLIIAKEINYFNPVEADGLEEKIQKASQMIGALIKSLCKLNNE